MKTLVLCAILLLSHISYSAQTLSFGIVPQQSASKLARLWGPILKKVSEDTGIQLQFATAPDIPTFEKRLAAGEYDLAYMNPYHYTVFHDTNGYQALAKAKDKRIKGIIVVRKDSGINDLNDLDKSQLAFPAPAAFAASILPRSHLSGIGLDYSARYVSSHDSVYRTVAKGLYPAGGGVIRTFKNVAPEIRDQLKVLWTTKGYTPHAIAAHPRVNSKDMAAIGRALEHLDSSPEGKTLVKNIKIKGFEQASNEDWDDVRSLNLNLLSDL